MPKNSDKSAFIAAAIIMLVLFASFFFMPPLMLYLAGIHEYLAYAAGLLFIVAFIFVFWLRARYQKKRDDEANPQ